MHTFVISNTGGEYGTTTVPGFAGSLLIFIYCFSGHLNMFVAVMLIALMAVALFIAYELRKASFHNAHVYLWTLTLSLTAAFIAFYSDIQIALLSLVVFAGLMNTNSKAYGVSAFIIGSYLFFVTGQFNLSFTVISIATLALCIYINIYMMRLRRRICEAEQVNAELQSAKALHEKFVNDISTGKFSEHNIFAEHDALGKKLFEMGLKFRMSTEQEKVRSWEMNGLNELSQLIRKSADTQSTYKEGLAFIVKYLDANQGGLFTTTRQPGEIYVELQACYAYEKRKIKEAKIAYGQGLIGQCLADGEVTYLEKVPQNYVQITSGLGLATPTSLLIFPLQHNNDILGVIELAFFHKLHKHHLDFVTKASEILGSAISFNQKTAHTANMLLESQRLAAELREQQEELRQNMEELEATQEQLTREAKEREMLQLEVAKSKEFLNLVIDSVPIPVFAKDRNHRMVLVNRAVCELNNMSKEQMLGKSDYDFFAPAEADVFWRFEEDIFIRKTSAEKVEHAVRNGKETYTLDKKLAVCTEDGEEFLIGINIDITHAKMMEKQNMQQAVGNR